jgi:hypothetical protein
VTGNSVEVVSQEPNSQSMKKDSQMMKSSTIIASFVGGKPKEEVSKNSVYDSVLKKFQTKDYKNIKVKGKAYEVPIDKIGKNSKLGYQAPVSGNNGNAQKKSQTTSAAQEKVNKNLIKQLNVASTEARKLIAKANPVLLKSPAKKSLLHDLATGTIQNFDRPSAKKPKNAKPETAKHNSTHNKETFFNQNNNAHENLIRMSSQITDGKNF